MIQILENIRTKKKSKPHFVLEINYMIGDADGSTCYANQISTNNPYIERFLTLIDNLPERPGHWGLKLDNECITDLFKHKLISKDDYDFLSLFMGSYYDENTNELTESEEEYIEEISECIQSDTDYSFLTYHSYNLYYYDEYGVKHNTKIIK